MSNFCPICKAAAASFDDPQLQKVYNICENCALIFLDSRFYVSLTAEKSQYDNHNNDIQNVGYVKMFNDFIDTFWKLLPKDNQKTNKALDFGCGPGPVLATLLQNRGLQVHTYDPIYQPKVLDENIYFDLITATEVFEHLHDPLKVMQKLTSHLKKGGILALMTLFHHDDKEHFLQWWYRRDPTHVLFYRPKTFAYLAKTFGYEIVFCNAKRIIIMQKI